MSPGLANPVEPWYNRTGTPLGAGDAVERHRPCGFCTGHPPVKEVRLMFKKVTLVIELLKYELKFTLKSTNNAKTATKAQ